MRDLEVNRPLLRLDLDETLIHGSVHALPVGHDFMCGEYFVYKRPYVDEFIRECAGPAMIRTACVT